MLQFPAIGYATTFSANQPITDSAAAGTALATGHKTNNGMLGMAPDSTHLTSIAVQLKQRGYGIAIATSVAPDDATPGAFYAHVPHRCRFRPVAQGLEVAPERLAGHDEQEEQRYEEHGVACVCYAYPHRVVTDGEEGSAPVGVVRRLVEAVAHVGGYVVH